MNDNDGTMPAWRGRVDAIDGAAGRRWHQVVRPFAANAPAGLTLVGFASDAGVQRNHGRPGAAAGPQALRAQLANLAWHGGDMPLYDAGDVVVDGDALEAAQERYAHAVAKAMRDGHRVIGLGGGHEIAWASYQGIADALASDPRLHKLGIVNFDAHFDLRERESAERGTSGTPFLQIAEARRAAGLSFDYLCLGISEAANTPKLFARATSLGVRHVSDLDSCAGAAAETALAEFVDSCDAIYCTFCLDVLPAATAPGVSAPAGLGVPLPRVVELLRRLMAMCRGEAGRDKLVYADVAELNPQHDSPDARTARAAARIVYELAAPGK